MGIVTAIVGIAVTIFTYYGFFRDEVAENLIHECRLVAEGYEMIDAPGELSRFSGEEFRITLVDPQGSVLYESDADYAPGIHGPCFISGYAEMIAAGMADPGGNGTFAAKIKREADRMLTLIGDILRLSELDAAAGPAMENQVDLAEAARECAEELDSAAKARGIERYAAYGQKYRLAAE